MLFVAANLFWEGLVCNKTSRKAINKISGNEEFV